MTETERPLCSVCHKNPGTIVFPTKPLSRGVEPGQLVSLCATCRTLTDANTNLGKAIRFMDDAIKQLQQVRGSYAPPVEAENFAFDLTDKAKQLTQGINVVNGFVNAVNQRQNKDLSMKDFWGPNGKP
jgi:hypothetical protein